MIEIKITITECTECVDSVAHANADLSTDGIPTATEQEKEYFGFLRQAVIGASIAYGVSRGAVAQETVATKEFAAAAKPETNEKLN